MSHPSHDAADFRRARARSFMRSVVSLLSGKSNKLIPWDSVRDQLGLRGMIWRGTQTVPVAAIVGSVGRFNDFDAAFLPASNALQERWRRVNRAYYEDVNLPPISLYKVGEVYFVLDGNHRVSVAREHGVEFIDAEVREARIRIPLSLSDVADPEHLEIAGEYNRFLERTRLDQLRPGQEIRFSIGGGYERLIEHIAVHRYFMGLDLQRAIDEDEAVAHWYDTVYMPVINAVRAHGILADFPGRTEADLYLWIADHLHHLRAQHKGESIDAEAAAADYAEKYGDRSPLERMQDALSQLLNG